MKKCIYSMFILTIIFSSIFGTSVMATEDLDEESVNEITEKEKALIDFGFLLSTIEDLPAEEIDDIYLRIMEDPDSISVSNSVISVDNLEIIELYANIDDETLLELDLIEEDELEKINEKLEELSNLSEEEFIEQYESNPVEYKLVQMALEENPEYNFSEFFEEDLVTSSGSIANSKMTFSLTVKNNSTETRPDYDVTASYNWKTPYFVDIFSDFIVIAWGGELNNGSNKSEAEYYSTWIKKGKGFKDYSHTGKWTLDDMKINQSLTFSVSQTGKNLTKNKKGYVKTRLHQFSFGKNKKSTKVIARYGHAIFGVSGISIDVGSGGVGASVQFGKKFDQSPLKTANIKY